jgi:adenylylsulfate kinase
MNHIGWCVWVTGLPGSGKSVISQALLEKLLHQGIQAQILSSDLLRKAVTPNPTYTQQERDLLYGILVEVARLLTEYGVNIIIDATGNLRKYRQNARKKIACYIEAYLDCSLEVCIQRETKRGKTFNAPKHIYKRALQRETSTVPGLGASYEPPLKPEITLDTTKFTPKECAQKILDSILKRPH